VTFRLAFLLAVTVILHKGFYFPMLSTQVAASATWGVLALLAYVLVPWKPTEWRWWKFAVAGVIATFALAMLPMILTGHWGMVFDLWLLLGTVFPSALAAVFASYTADPFKDWLARDVTTIRDRWAKSHY
jgi:ABC-type multidrug transport system permease subunit